MTSYRPRAARADSRRPRRDDDEAQSAARRRSPPPFTVGARLSGDRREGNPADERSNTYLVRMRHTTMTKRAILEKFAFYRQLPKTDQLALFNSAREVALRAGADFYREGDEVTELALVGSGGIRTFKASLTGREITLYHVQEGEACLVNMLSVFLTRPAMASARIEVAGKAVVIPAAVFRPLVGSSSTVREFVFEAMAVRLIDVVTLIEEIAFRRMDERLAEYLEQRFENRGAGPRGIPVTHEEIARELGTAREVISRLLKEFERAGAVRLARGSIELRDDAALRKAVLRARGS